MKRDYVQAYKWLNICAAKGDTGCVTQRDLVAKKLKRRQLKKRRSSLSSSPPKRIRRSREEVMRLQAAFSRPSPPLTHQLSWK